MIELKIKGPHKQNIIEFIRRKSKVYKDKNQTFRPEKDLLNYIEEVKLSKINLPSISTQQRKNNIPKSIPLILLNKVTQNCRVTENEEKNAARIYNLFINK